jgi:protease PrsW
MSALDTKAILEGRRPGRHSIALIIGITLSILCMLVVFGYFLVMGSMVGGAAGVFGFVVSLAAAIIPVSIIIPLILLLDRLEPEPAGMLWFAFLWGAGVAVLAALILNTVGASLYALPTFGADWGDYFTATVIAPVVEESAKGAVLLLLLWRRRREINTLTDGVIYAGMVAAGFAFTENISYFLVSLFESGLEGLAFTFVLRGVIAPLGHPIYTAMIGIGVAYVALNRGPGRWAALFVGWAAAVLLHGLWNGSTLFGWLGLGVAYLIIFFVLIGIILVAVTDRRRVIKAIAYYLPAYIPTGLVTHPDIRMQSTMGGRKRARRWAQNAAGRGGYRAMEDYQLAATEVALLHMDWDRGVAERDWQQRRDSLLALMHVAREAFLGQVQRPVAPAWAGEATDSGFMRRANFQDVIDRARAAREGGGVSGPGHPPQNYPPQGGYPPQG